MVGFQVLNFSSSKNLGIQLIISKLNLKSKFGLSNIPRRFSKEKEALNNDIKQLESQVPFYYCMVVFNSIQFNHLLFQSKKNLQ